VQHGQVAQDLGELTCGELARSTGAGGVIGQSFRHTFLSPNSKRKNSNCVFRPF
jgi:hypothetical protein